MRKSTTKNALLMSVLSLFLCFAMLTGTTFAWFTDTVESGVNQIVAGNLDVELTHTNKKVSDETVAGATNLFSDIDAKKWEPNAMAMETFTVKNLGNLALKYELSLNVSDVTTGKDGTSFATALMVAVVNGTVADRAAAEAIAESEWKTLESISKAGDLMPTENGVTDEDVWTVIIWWKPSDNDNNFNMNNGATGEMSATIGVKLFATQLQAEEDSFGPDYDAGAPWVGGIDLDWYDPTATELTINSAEALAGFAAIVNGTATSPVTTFAATTPVTIHDDFAGKIVKLDRSIDLNDVSWTPIGRIGTTSTDFTYAFKGTFDGQNNTIYNLEVSNDGWAGVFGIAYKAEIKNLKVSGVALNSNRMTGAIVGQLYGSLDNCHVEDAEIMVVPNAVGNSYDNGDKVGGIVGWIGDNGNNRTLTNCSATDVKLSAYRDVGGIAGYVASSTVVSGNAATKVEITVDQTSHFYGEKDTNAGAIIGRDNGAVVDTNTTSEITISETYYKNGLTLFEDGSGEVVMYLVPADYAEKTVTVPEGITAIGGYAFAYNSNVETIVLSSSVKTLNDRAFRDTSASTVVLNEGLENISYQAFRNAVNVKEVVIPSTVKTISKEAFQNSGVETLVIPANVETIEYGGLRDMKMLETVVIEGNVDIPVYAFRACTNLRTVVLKGDDVTFGAGSSGMIFTNKESGDGSAITVYVANETVKERLLASDTAANDYGGYTIIIGNPYVINYDANKGGIQNHLDKLNAGCTLVLPEGTYETSGSFIVPAGVTIKAAEGATVVFRQLSAAQDNIFNCKGDARFENITFESNLKGYAITDNTKNHDTDGDITVIGCNFKGIATEKNWGIYKNLNGNLIIKDCTFDNYNNAICGVNNGNGSTTTVTGCTFTNINGEAVGYVSSTVSADFEANLIADNTGLTAENVIGY